MKLTDLGLWVVIFLFLRVDIKFARGEDYITWNDFSISDDDKQSLEHGDDGDRKRVIVVDQNGDGDSTTVQGAVDLVPENNSQRVKIYIHPGIYREKVNVPQNKPYISFIGDRERTTETVITWNDKAKDKDENGIELGTWKTATVTVHSDYFCATWITFENTVVAIPGEKGKQAVALRIGGDKAMFYKVRILGYQDTLLDEIGTHYYYKSFIQGSVDFIFGNAKSLFQKCVIRSIAEEHGAIAAHKRSSSSEDTGFSFVGCKIRGSGKVFLGRAWGDYSRTIYSYCTIDDVIIPSGWSDWNKPYRQKTAVFGEFSCRGKGAARAHRVPWSKTLKLEEAKPFLGMNFINGEQWLKL